MRAIPAGHLLDMVGAYMTEKTGMSLTPGMYQALAIVTDKNDFAGAIVITNYRSRNCEMSAAADHPVIWYPAVCRAVFTYIFKQLDCARCTCITTKSNTKARNTLEALGFTLEGNIRLGYEGLKDALIYGLLASECRFLADDSGENLVGEGHTSSAHAARSGGNRARSRRHEQRNGGCTSQPKPDQSVHAAR